MASPVLDYWHRRCENWALWVCSGSRTGSVGISMIYRGRRAFDERPPALPVPLVGEASDTDRLVHRLSADQQRALVANYVWTGTLSDRAGSLGVCVDTLRNRVRAACFRLDDMQQAQRRPTGTARQSA